jgi:hypothetical protein
MKLQLEAMALAMPKVTGHPNRLKFRGVLTLVGVASQYSPHGAEGHRVRLTYQATEAALPSLLGMALDYSPEMDGHDAQRKIGIITQADIEPLAAEATTGQLAISGFLYEKDFPEVMREIAAGDGVLGMSYELADAWVPDKSASIWTVTKFTFTGAAVLRRDKAAYPQTWIRLGDGAARPSPRIAAQAFLSAAFRKSRTFGD